MPASGEGNSNDILRPETPVRTGFRTGVRFSSPPPNERYANTILEANGMKFAVFGGVFGVMVDIADYDTEQHLQTKKATYADIQAWVKRLFGEHVTNLDISRTKKLCGLVQNEYKGREAAEGYYIPKHRNQKEALVIEAFKHFGMIDENFSLNKN